MYKGSNDKNKATLYFTCLIARTNKELKALGGLPSALLLMDDGQLVAAGSGPDSTSSDNELTLSKLQVQKKLVERQIKQYDMEFYIKHRRNTFKAER